MLSFICTPCKTGADIVINTDNPIGPLGVIAKKDWHRKCKGGTWCDCFHRVK